MSKSNKNAQTAEVFNETAEIEEVNLEVSTAKSYPVPLDGTKADEYIKEQGSVSKAIRTLTTLGYTRGETAKALNKRYQHVRNVLITPVKKTA